MGNYILYSHAGSGNHGCEALLRTTLQVIGKDVEAVYSDDPAADKKYGLDEIVELREEKGFVQESPLEKWIYAVKYKLLHDDKLYFRREYGKFIRDIVRDKVYISIGGDNYCYHFSEWLEVLNKEITKRGARSVLWGCSINQDELQDPAVVADLERYSLITARESLTFELLRGRLKKPVVRYVPDTAFLLPTIQEELPAGFIEGRTVGINASPVIFKNGSDAEAVKACFVKLVDHIIDTTDYQIALIPHVAIQGNNDRLALEEIRDACKDGGRTVVIPDTDCRRLKGYIARCCMFVGARTHATIAAYSSCVPTLVIGYSVKSLGIAKDLFGTNEHYVLPVQNLQNPEELIAGFEWIRDRKDKIKAHLEEIMPEYIGKIGAAKQYLEEL